MHRPSTVILTFTDPWSGELALQVSGNYSCHDFASGYWSRLAFRMKRELPKCQPILEGRTPKVSWVGLCNNGVRWQRRTTGQRTKRG